MYISCVESLFVKIIMSFKKKGKIEKGYSFERKKNSDVNAKGYKYI